MVLSSPRLPSGVPRTGTVVSLTRFESKIQVHCFSDSLKLASRLARALGSRCFRVGVHRFPDGETLPRVRLPVSRRAIIVRNLDTAGSNLFEVLLTADALRRAGARHVTLVTPYLPYMRQDKVFHAGEPLSQQVLGNLLSPAVDKVLTVEAHLHRVRRLSEVVPGRSLSAAPLLAAWIRLHAKRCFIVGPDGESGPWLRAMARRAGVPCIVGSKRRLGDRRVEITLPEPPHHRRALLIDDIASSGATLAAAARQLRRHGVRRIDAIVVHAIFAQGAMERIKRAGVERILSCDTIAHPTNAISCAALIASALDRPHQ